MLLTVVHQIKYAPGSMKPVLFPDTEVARLFKPDVGLLNRTFKELFTKVRQATVDDFSYYAGSIKDIQLPSLDSIKVYFANHPLPSLHSILDIEQKFNLLQVKNKEELLHMSKNEVSSTILGGYKKNVLVSDYHSEEFIAQISTQFDDSMTDNEKILEQIKLNTLAEKAVLTTLNIDGLLDEDTLAKRLSIIEKRLAWVNTSLKGN